MSSEIIQSLAYDKLWWFSTSQLDIFTKFHFTILRIIIEWQKLSLGYGTREWGRVWLILPKEVLLIQMHTSLARAGPQSSPASDWCGGWVTGLARKVALVPSPPIQPSSFHPPSACLLPLQPIVLDRELSGLGELGGRRGYANWLALQPMSAVEAQLSDNFWTSSCACEQTLWLLLQPFALLRWMMTWCEAVFFFSKGIFVCTQSGGHPSVGRC
jgi:hypothetical protein